MEMISFTFPTHPVPFPSWSQPSGLSSLWKIHILWSLPSLSIFIPCCAFFRLLYVTTSHCVVTYDTAQKTGDGGGGGDSFVFFSVNRFNNWIHFPAWKHTHTRRHYCNSEAKPVARPDYRILHNNLLFTLSSWPGLELFARHVCSLTVHVTA